MINDLPTGEPEIEMNYKEALPLSFQKGRQ